MEERVLTEFLGCSKETILELLKELTDREARVIELRYGLIDGICRTAEECAKEFNVSVETITMIEVKGLKKLRMRLAIPKNKSNQKEEK